MPPLGLPWHKEGARRCSWGSAPCDSPCTGCYSPALAFWGELSGLPCKGEVSWCLPDPGALLVCGSCTKSAGMPGMEVFECSPRAAAWPTVCQSWPAAP